MNSAKLKVVSTVVVVLLLSLFGITGYAYHVGNTIEPNADFLTKLRTGIAHFKIASVSLESEMAMQDDVNYVFDANADIAIKRSGNITNQASFTVQSGAVLSRDSGLQQRLQLWSVEFSSSGSRSNSGSFRNIDIVSDNEKVYSYVEEWAEKLTVQSGAGLDSGTLGTKEELISKLSAIYAQKKYAMFDNSKPGMNLLGDLSKNELIRKMAVSLVTSNPTAYFKKVGGNQDLENFLRSDKPVHLLFKEGTPNSEGTKIGLTVNDESCKDLAPVIAGIYQQSLSKGLSDQMWISSEKIVKQCQQSIGQINPLLSMMTQIYKEGEKTGDIQAGNYRFVISQGNVLNINLSYKAHVLDKWSLDIKAPGDQFVLSANGDSEKMLASLLKMNVDVPGVKVVGDITNGTGKIDVNIAKDMDANEKADIEVTGFIQANDYLISQIDLSGKVTMDATIATFAIKGNETSGNANLLVKTGEEQDAKIDFDYDIAGETANLNLQSKQLNAKAQYEKNKLNLEYDEKGFDGSDRTKADFHYDSGKVQGNFVQNEMSLSLSGAIQSFDNFDIAVNGHKSAEKIDLSIKALPVSTNETQYSCLLNRNDGKMLEANVNKKSKEEDGYAVTDIKWNFSIPDESLEGEFNLHARAKQGGAVYEIPKDFSEAELRLPEITILPSLAPSEMNQKQAFMVWVAAGAIAGTIAFASLQVYTKSVKQATVIADLSSLKSLFTIRQTEGIDPFTLINRSEAHEGKNLSFGWVVADSTTYKVGTPNYEALGWFWWARKNLDGNDYLIGIRKNAQGNVSYQVIGFVGEGSTKKVEIIGNYVPQSGDPEGLIFDENGDPYVSNRLVSPKPSFGNE